MIESAPPHELAQAQLQTQLDVGFQVSAGAFTASQISVPSAAEQHVAQTARRPAVVGCGVSPFGFGVPAIGAVAVLSLLCISFAAGFVSIKVDARPINKPAIATLKPRTVPNVHLTEDALLYITSTGKALGMDDLPKLLKKRNTLPLALSRFEEAVDVASAQGRRAPGRG
ncbi:hypothetical protein CYMTET_14633 [Cymbomonas tetramitiformis]|uniref:Uncharacterized protein n=1 Tax=Cymbomonas tetramitiformis TaxID=36881 RepID=A0AAE0GG64_9CHLO|nr:hypothetical protein CYMTET_14633 [Cymbomonas tetramitiformis]